MVKLLQPSQAQLIKQVNDIEMLQASVKLGPQGQYTDLVMRKTQFRSLMDAQYLFIPVNNSEAREIDPSDITMPLGEHWSLLFVSRIDRQSIHYDSAPPINNKSAKKMYDKVMELWGEHSALQMLQDHTIRQTNGSDCGVIVCLIMYQLLLRLLQATGTKKVSLQGSTLVIDAREGRQAMTREIKRIRARPSLQRLYPGGQT